MRYRNDKTNALLVYRQPAIGSAFEQKLSVGMECEGTLIHNGFLETVVKGNRGFVEVRLLTKVDSTPPPVEPPVSTFPQSFTLVYPNGHKAEYKFIREIE